jgi:hypothetical protein
LIINFFQFLKTFTMKKAFVIFGLLLFATFTFAQRAINQTLIDYLENIDKSQTKVPTGILIEQGFPMYNLEEYQGQVLTDSNKVDADLFGWLYMGLALGNVNNSTIIPDPQTYISMCKNTYMGGGNLPLAILNYRYNYIKANAISDDVVDRAFYVFNDKLYENPPTLGQESPFGESTLFVAAPMMPNSSQANVTFSIPNNLYFSNQASALQSIEVDLGDGSGYRAVGLGQTVSAYYGANGEKALKVKCTHANGQVFESHSVLRVNDPSLDVNLAEAPPFSYNSTPDILNETNVAGCKLSYFFHCPQQGLQKPFIFIEGFDPIPEGVDGTQTFEAMIKRLGRKDNLVPTSQKSMLERLYDEGYDLIYVDFTQGAGDIVENAQVVKNVIRRVNALKAQNGSTSKNRVLGASMGGVIGKWAIREMEIAGENHDIDKYMTFDSPLRGANVPMGIQFMIKDIETREAYVKMRINSGIVNVIFTVKTVKIGEFIPGVQRIKALLTAPAAKQMLFYNAFTPSGNPREWHDAFYARLAALGDLKVDYSVVSNGSSINQPQLLNAGELYAAITGTGSTPVSIFKGPNSPSIDVRVKLDLRPFAIPASGSGGVYGGSILLRLPVSGNIPLPVGLRIDVGSQINSTVSDLKPLDSAPGGFSNFGFPSQAANLSFGNVTVRGDFGTKSKGLWCFVPTFSALDIPEPANVNQSFTCTSTNTSANRCIGSVDASAFSTEVGAIGTAGGTAHNQDHVSINQRNATFLLNQLVVGVGLNNLATSLTRTFNFGASDQIPSQTTFQPLATPNVLARGLTVEGTGQLWVNRSGRINYIDELNNFVNRSNSTFDLAIRRSVVACVANNASVIVKDNGRFHIGEVAVNLSNIGIVHIETGATLDIQAGGNLQIEDNSQLIVESGGKLIINAGANINLVGLQSKITVKSGGELIINDNFTFSGNGYFNFEAGNILTLNNDWILRGSGRTTRLINIGHNATLAINGGRRLTIDNALIRKEAPISNQDVMLFNNGSTFRANNVTFDDQSIGGALAFIAVNEPVALNNNPWEMDFSFRDCHFRGANYGMFVGGDAGGIFDFRNFNVEFINTNFNNRQTAYYAQHGNETIFDNCQIIGCGIDIQRTYWLQMRHTTMRGTRAATGNNSTVGIKIRNSIHNWITHDCLISDYGTGIDGFTDVLATDVNGNIRLDKATIQLCQTALNLRGGANIGLLFMDCTRILENENGIKGWDLLLMAHSRNGTANIFTRPANNPNSLFFETIFRERQETDISLFGTYWNNQTPVIQSPTTQTVNDFWKFYQRDNQTGHIWPWAGRIFTDPIVNLNATDFAACGGIQLGVRANAPINTADAVVLVGGLWRDTRIQEAVAMNELEQNNLSRAIQLFAPIAAIPNSTRDSANSAVRYFVDVARVMAQGAEAVTLRSSNNYWVPESLVGMPKAVDNEQLVLSPNPANNTVKLDIKSGNYHLRVLNTVGQTIFEQNTEGSLSVDVSTWTNGIYLFEVTNKATNKRQRSKIVVQH